MPADPQLATRIKRARERMRLTQQQLADRLGVDRKTIDNWENGRTTPRSSLGALEEVLGLTPPAEVYTDPAEAELWSLTSFTEDERRDMIAAYRQRRLRRTG